MPPIDADDDAFAAFMEVCEELYAYLVRRCLLRPAFLDAQQIGGEFANSFPRTIGRVYHFLTYTRSTDQAPRSITSRDSFAARTDTYIPWYKVRWIFPRRFADPLPACARGFAGQHQLVQRGHFLKTILVRCCKRIADQFV
jgi:hypothetical protein